MQWRAWPGGAVRLTARACRRPLPPQLPLQGQLTDFVVDIAEPSVTARLQERYDLATDGCGIAAAWLPPGAELSIFCHSPPPTAQLVPSTVADPQRQVAVSHRAAQFVGFELQQMSCVRVALAEFGTSRPVAGARIRFFMAQDELGNLCDAPLGALETGEDGATGWMHARTGALVRAEVAGLPWKYLGMDSMERVCEQEQMLRLTGEHEMRWYVPKKPSVSVRVHDAASGERVIGIRYRVMSRPHTAELPPSRVSFGGTLLLDARVRCEPFSALPLRGARPGCVAVSFPTVTHRGVADSGLWPAACMLDSHRAQAGPHLRPGIPDCCRMHEPHELCALIELCASLCTCWPVGCKPARC